MFNSKQTSLLERKPTSVSAKATTVKNTFLTGLAKESAKTLSGNGALKFDSCGSEFVNQFSKLGSYKTPRTYQEISNDCEVLWGIDPLLCVKFITYIRMINRKTDLLFLGIKTDKPQIGAELKHEGIMRQIWLHNKSKNTYWENIGLFMSAGCLKDIIVMLRYDLVYHGWEGKTLDWPRFGNLILSILSDKNSVNLMKKYLPHIRSTSACKTIEAEANTIIAKWICSLLFGNKVDGSTYKKYRLLKTSGTAHEWQKLISRKEFNKIDFNTIHGRALTLLAKGKFFKNQGLQEKYLEWIGDKKTVKCTGYVHEILCELDSNHEKVYEETVNKQFAELVNKVKNGEENLTKMIVVRDTSGSMSSIATGTKFSCYNIGKALALYFSEFLTGQFANHWIEFNSTAKLHSWKGETTVNKWRLDKSSFVGGTNFQSVIDLFCQMKRQGVSESDFPQGILCISDSELDKCSLEKTNVEVALEKLRNSGFSQSYIENFKIILWNLQNNYYGKNSGQKFETFGETKNTFYLSGYSAASIKFILTSKAETDVELFNLAMDQELLNLLKA